MDIKKIKRVLSNKRRSLKSSIVMVMALIDDERAVAINLLAEEVRSTVVIPHCKKYGYTYHTWNDDYFFARGKKVVGGTVDTNRGVPVVASKETKRVVEVLGVSIDEFPWTIGALIDEYPKPRKK